MATGYITGHRHRASAELTIQYNGGSIAVPITQRSVRHFSLMSEDYIQLDFSLAEAIQFNIGSKVVDGIFGTFYITTEQMPKYNTNTGGYDYSLRFDADYMRWKNFLHCLVANGKRMETSWALTDRLSVHAQQIADNVNVLFAVQSSSILDPDTQEEIFVSTGYAIEVQDIAGFADIKFIQYDGISIIEAMNRIAEEFNCEWWITDDKKTIGSTRYDHTIHFGKCELNNTAFQFELGSNVESMDIARNQQTYANRIYAYGGTQNVPEDYDKRLLFRATNYDYSAGSVKDSARDLTLDMIVGQGSTAVTTFTIPAAVGNTSANPHTYTHTSNSQSLKGSQTFDINLDCRLQMEGDFAATDIPSVVLTAKLKYGTNTIDLPVISSGGYGIGVWYYRLNYLRELNLGSNNVNVQIVLTWSITFAQGSVHTGDEVEIDVEGTASCTADASAAMKDLTLTFNGTNYPAKFHGEDGKIYFTGAKPSRASFNNKDFTLSPLDLLKIPQNWYTRDYDTGTLRMAGEKRIHLPLADYPNRYIDGSNTQGSGAPYINVNEVSQIVEEAIVFNNIYPKLRLRIKTLGSWPKTETIVHTDGTTTYEKWTEWTFTAEYEHDGQWSDFEFKTSYMLDGAKLQAVFSTPQSVQNSGWLLSGMAFDLGYDERWFKIIRNEDYGVKLPNETLVPSVGDEFVLIGWNPRAMNALGLVAAAEEELATKAEEYLAAINEGQFTFTCRMMSDIFWRYAYGGRDASGTTPKTYGLLDLGAKVTISNDALPGGSKTSRIIGYEYKLDIPYDTPTYVIGETEAFSRLKQLEKKITKL